MDDLMFYANEVVADTYAKASRMYNRQFPTPTISFGKRGAVAGVAYYYKNSIVLNEQLFRENVDEFINRTIPHEAAHLISFQMFHQDGMGHGGYWKSVMKTLGVPDSTRCHSYNTTPARRVPRCFPHVCDCGKVRQLTSIKANRIKKGTSSYRCVRCNSTIRPLTY